MKKILLMHGANLNKLGNRNPQHYGKLTLHDIEILVREEATKLNLALLTFQSNHEGDLIDELQKRSEEVSGVLINPGAFTHYSFAIHDALIDTNLPIVEVHLSDIHSREPWRRQSITANACLTLVSGKKEKGYIEALHILAEHLQP